MLPPAHEAAAWFVDTVRAHVDAGRRIGADAVRLLMAVAPGDPLVEAAIELTDVRQDSGLASVARAASERLGAAAVARDEALARDTIGDLEVDVLRLYRPSHGLGCFEDDVAVAGAMLDAFEIGGDETHLMMAEELLLGVLRRYWHDRLHHTVRVNCEAAVALARLASHPGKEGYRDRALEVLHGYAGTYRALGIDAAPFVSALHLIS